MTDAAFLQAEHLTAIAWIPTGGREAFFAQHPEWLNRAVVQGLTDEVPALVRTDLVLSQRMAEVAAWVADQIDDDYSRGRAARAAGHVAHVAGRQGESLSHYERALDLLQRSGSDLDVAITKVNTLLPLIYAGRYETAFSRAAEARVVFTERGDRLRLARLETNVGNILYRQDRIEEARDHYERAHAYFITHGTPQDLAVTLRNLAVCHISLNDFDRALEYYNLARDSCREHDLTRLVLENDYNIAYLYYLRGEYTRAIDMYNATRVECDAQNDVYHRGLCDLDQAEMYLELNLTEDGEQLARDALARFEQIGLRYEAAKALTFVAIACSRRGQAGKALQLFESAGERFAAEGNAVWPGLIELYRALVLFDESRHAEAMRGAEAALAAFERPAFVTKAALAQLLIARLRLAVNDVDSAHAACRDAMQRVAGIHSPGVTFQAQVVRGQVYERLGDRRRALAAYRRAHRALETLRNHLAGDELKVAFLKNKLVVFESLVHLLIADRSTPAQREQAFALIEQAKSRSLADLISFRAHALMPVTPPRSDLVERIHRIREELNWYYHQIDLGPLAPQAVSNDKVAALRSATQQHERQLVHLLTEMRGTDAEFDSMQPGGTVDLDELRAAIPENALVVEFYEARGVVYTATLGRRHLDIQPVTSAGRIRETMRLLTFQLSKFRLGDDYVRRFESGLYQATMHHLQELYLELMAPVRRGLDAEHLIVVPHDVLHHLPFHALHDGERFLCDDFSLSYAPSASVFRLCCSKADEFEESSLVLGVPDGSAPHIADEAAAVAAILPNASLYVGNDVTEARLRDEGRQSRFVHIAAHGYFRQDNPMFSSIRLGQSQLTLSDLYRLRLSAELVTLSGCGTGLNVVVGGDEMLGLMRGLFYAGAHAVLLTLWDVNDRSTAGFMPRFYRELAAEPANTSAALGRAMAATRDEYRHPYYWAPFVLAGKFTRPQPPRNQ